MRVGATVMMRSTLMPSPKESQQSTSPDASTAVQMDISVKIALDHPPSAENAIGPEETTRRLALNFGRSGQSRRKPLKRRERQSNWNGLGVPVAKVSCEYNSLNYHSQVGSPIELELGRGSKLVLDSASTHTYSKIPDNARIRSFNH
jgi:hypothetical protein